MEKNKHNTSKAILSLLCMMFLIYIGMTLLKNLRVDFTSENLYTLSEGSKSILKKLDSPIKLKLYYSKTAANKGTEGLRGFNNYFHYVKEVLHQFKENSRNNLSLEIIDPRPDTSEEEDAMVYGLKKFNLTETENYFFGLVAENESGSEKIIDFFDPNQKDKLEYELTKLIFTVLNPQKKTIGVLSSLEVVSDDLSPYMAQIMQMQGKPAPSSWISFKLLKELYTTKKIDPKTEKITGVDLLVVVHPKGFSDATLFAIDQYVLNSGNLLVFVDPNVVSDRQRAMGGHRPSSSPDENFSKLLAKWGIQLESGAYAGDKYLSGTGRLNANLPPSKLLPLLNCTDECSSRYKDPVTSGVKSLSFIFPGVLKASPMEGVTHSILLSTTDKGNSYVASGMEMNNPEALWKKFKEGEKPVVLAYKALGKFKSAFPNGVEIEVEKDPKSAGTTESKDSKPTKKKLEGLKESSKDSAVIVFSDVDFISDMFAFKNTFLGPVLANDNSSLLLNSIESLAGDIDLISVRSKGKINRPFELINEIELEGEKQTEDKVSEINTSIEKFETELQKLGSQANEGNIALLQNEGIQKKKELTKRIVSLKKELRSVKREGREKIETIGKFFQLFNTLLIPIIVVICGLVYYRRRENKISKKEKNSTHKNIKALNEVKA